MLFNDQLTWRARRKTLDLAIAELADIMSEDMDQVSRRLPALAKYELRQMRLARELLRALRLFAAHEFEFFFNGFYGEPPQLKPSPDYPPRYVLRTLLDQIAVDLSILQQAVAQRRLHGAQSTQQGDTLYIADLLAEYALQPAVTNHLLPGYAPVLTFLSRTTFTRLIPYHNAVLIGLTYASMTSKDRRPTRDYLAIPHEVGHYVYQHGRLAGTEQLIYRWLQGQLRALGLADDDWRVCWLEEMFADAYGLLVAGPVMTLDFQDLLTDNLPAHFQTGIDHHPIDALRPLIQTALLRRFAGPNGTRRFVHAPDALDANWETWLARNREQFQTQTPHQTQFTLPGGERMSGAAILQALAPVLDLIVTALGAADGNVGKRKRTVWRPWTRDLADSNVPVAKLYEFFTRRRFRMRARRLHAVDEAGSHELLRTLEMCAAEMASGRVFEPDEWLPLFLFKSWSSEGDEADTFKVN